MGTKDIHINMELNALHSGNKEKIISRELNYNEIISTIAHELRTPVATIKSNIQLLRKFSYDIDHSVLEESFSLCDESVDEVVRFLDKIQLLNKANKCKIHPVYSPFGVKKIVQHLYAQLAQIDLDYHRIILQWDLTDREIISDKKYLHLIVFKTVSNALKFSIAKVQLNISTSNHQLSIRIQDGGIGIAEQEIEMIFQPFYRASNVKHISGTGLGLAIVHSLVKNLGGEIQVSSTIGKGTTIQINIPYERSDQNTCN